MSTAVVASDLAVTRAVTSRSRIPVPAAISVSRSRTDGTIVPAAVDRGAYQHNFQAARSFKVGPYHRPPGWSARRWGYDEILPRGFWGPQYVLADYWLFALEVPPVGFEWVRYGADALLINTSNGEILQVEYGVFA